MTNDAFQQYRRTQIAEMRPYIEGEALAHNLPPVSISPEDIKAGSPKVGDMIARNPKNHNDQWLVAAQYFVDNFEPMASDQGDENPGPASGKETSSRVSSIAARLLGLKVSDVIMRSDDYMKNLVADIHAVAGSALSQDETPGQGAKEDNHVTRLKRERDELDDRLIKLELFLRHRAPGCTERHKLMLHEQSRIMSELLAILDERLCDLAVDERATLSQADGEELENRHGE